MSNTQTSVAFYDYVIIVPFVICVVFIYENLLMKLLEVKDKSCMYNSCEKPVLIDQRDQVIQHINKHKDIQERKL